MFVLVGLPLIKPRAINAISKQDTEVRTTEAVHNLNLDFNVSGGLQRHATWPSKQQTVWWSGRPLAQLAGRSEAEARKTIATTILYDFTLYIGNRLHGGWHWSSPMDIGNQSLGDRLPWNKKALLCYFIITGRRYRIRVFENKSPRSDTTGNRRKILGLSLISITLVGA